MRERSIKTLIGLVGYTYVGYPALLWLVSRTRTQVVRKQPYEPSVTIIIPAHNEEAILAEKLESVLAQGYPEEQIEILIASDGSTDQTNQIGENYAEQRVRVLALPRGGKAQALNEAARQARNDILVFTDANAIWAQGALHALMQNFADPQVGGVSANEQRQPGTTTSAVGLGERLYWEYDKWLKRAETRVGSMVSASGSLYAIRRKLFHPIVDPTATDDFAISTQVIRAGYRLVFEPEAITFEPSMTKSNLEFRRKVRIVTRGLRSVYGIRDLLLPWNSGFYAIQVWSHKILRRLVGFGALAIFGLSLGLVDRLLYRLLVLGQTLLYGLAFVGWLGRTKSWGRKRWLYIPYYFCLSNVAAMLGVIQFLRQRRLSIWQPQREA